MTRRTPPPHFRARPQCGTSLVTVARWLAAGYEVAPQGRDWLDPDDEYGRRGPIYPAPGERGIGHMGAVSMRTGDVYCDLDDHDDPDDETDAAAAAPVETPRAFRTGPAWDRLVEAGGFREAKPGRWGRASTGRGTEVFRWREEDGYDDED